MSFTELVSKYQVESISQRSKGDKFERIIKGYFFTDPKYSDLVNEAWLWNEFPYKGQFGSNDVGIDLVVKATNGDFWAIQCKCLKDGAYIDKPSVDTFMTTSSKSFETEKGDVYRFAERFWVSTTNNWSSKATDSLKNQIPQVTRINLFDLQEAPVDWNKLENNIHGSSARDKIWDPKPHQKVAIEKSIEYFKSNERGKLIMACGTGKTYTSLRIAEKQTNGTGTILFLVPSIALLSQTLREWTAQATKPIDPICICSDKDVSKKKTNNDDTSNFSVIDLALPASTNVANIRRQFEMRSQNKDNLKVVFSTYQSIDVISKAQKEIGFDFDLVICDEAHRTTGVTLDGDDESSFVKVHDNRIISGTKRLYMTATPRLYDDSAKKRAEEASAEIASMDDPIKYGEEIYRIGFGEAVDRGLLSDYKVLVLTMSETDVTPEVQKILANSEKEIVGADDVSKLIGCINAMSKQIINEKGSLSSNDLEPMKRAVAFTPRIKDSRKITNTINEISATYKKSVPDLKRKTLQELKAQHIDGGMSAVERDKLMAWLKDEPPEGEARVLTNVRCLSEGVDVPSLDAVMFLSARNSQVDVVQSVGRVMRTSPGKKYGYIIIPVVIPSGVEPEEALGDNQRYKVVWTVLNALRAHDDRFNAIVNQIDLNKNRPEQVLIGRVDPDGDQDPSNDSERSKDGLAKIQQTRLHFDALQQAIYAKMVQKVGERAYWENWARDIADIAERHIKRITKIVDEDDKAHMAFRQFVKGLQKNINPSITEQQAIEMLSQHIITKPVFEALFDGYSFVQNNAVSISMQKALDAIEAQAIEDGDVELLEGFYSSVRRRAEGIDNSEGKQRIIVELYDKFFKTAFPRMVEQLGIVYTPLEVVDFIIHSVNDVLKKEFGRSLSDENVNILDPFTGTGTFITRLLQSGVIEPKDLERKYKHEIFANEIVLLAYYIAAVNVENAYHDLLEKDEYESFEGIVLTDTFQLRESDDNTKLFSDALAENSERLERQQNAPLRVIIGNPPYSVGQKSANDNAQNQKYVKLDKRIADTYAQLTDATNKNSLYDSYIKAIRWATDRLSDEGGVIGFVSNGSWIDGNAQNGLRKSLEKEFTSIYVFNLRGNQRTSGETSRKEGGKIFGSGSRTPISITLLVKDPAKKSEKAEIHYHDIGDYLSREQKLEIIADYKSVNNKSMPWKLLTPNEHGDWINLRNDKFDSFIPLVPDKKFNNESKSFFALNSLGVGTSRDAWTYNYSKNKLVSNMHYTVSFYNTLIDNYKMALKNSKNARVEDIISNDPTKISWSSSLLPKLKKQQKSSFDKLSVKSAMYRPFAKSNLYFGPDFIHRRGQLDNLIFTGISVHPIDNKLICISQSFKDGSVLATNIIPDLHLIGDTQALPIYYWKKIESTKPTLFDNQENSEYVRHDGITDYILNTAKDKYVDGRIEKEDIFYYVYGLLHSPDYRKEFSNDLKKILPRLPLVDKLEDFWVFSKAGRELAELHINYEEVAPYEGVKVSGTQHNNYVVQKMKFTKKDQKDKIIYNAQITLENIPEKAYEYVVNGRSAIEWILDRYQVKTDKDSGIVNDPNDWAKEVGNPRYIIDLLLSVINVSVQTVDIVNSLPKLEFASD